MKPLKYAFAVLLCLCFLTAAAAWEQAEYVYTLTAVFTGGFSSGGENDPLFMTIQLPQDGRVVDLWIAENARFFADPIASGLQSEQITFAQFSERFVGHPIDIDFVVCEDKYFVVECRLILAN
jgi:hypothetical protein